MHKAPKVIIFIGPQGSGKGTQAKILNDQINGQYIGMGVLLREAGRQNTDFGRHIKDIVDSGVLVSQEDLQAVLDNHLKSLDWTRPVILDGVPRTIAQADYLMPLLPVSDKSEIVTLCINLPRPESIRRLQLRKVCVGCTKQTALNDSFDARACEFCGGKLVTRADDTEEAINKRLDLYENETKPVLDFLKERTTFYELDGRPPIEEVSKKIAEIIENNE